jgi:hypothetical protein
MGFLPELDPRLIPVTVPGDTGNYLHKFAVSIPGVLVAEGFDSALTVGRLIGWPRLYLLCFHRREIDLKNRQSLCGSKSRQKSLQIGQLRSNSSKPWDSSWLII